MTVQRLKFSAMQRAMTILHFVSAEPIFKLPEQNPCLAVFIL